MRSRSTRSVTLHLRLLFIRQELRPQPIEIRKHLAVHTLGQPHMQDLCVGIIGARSRGAALAQGDTVMQRGDRVRKTETALGGHTYGR